MSDRTVEFLPILIFFGLPLLILLIIIILIALRFRSYNKSSKSVIAEYELPKDISPLEADVLMWGIVSSNGLLGQFCSFARAGIVKISLSLADIKGRHGVTLLKNIDDTSFPESSRYILKSLSDSTHFSLQELSTQVRSELVDKGYLKTSKKPGPKPHTLSVVFTILVLASFVFFPPLTFALVLLGGPALTILWMPHQTPKGKDMKDYLKGLKKYLVVTQKSELSRDIIAHFDHPENMPPELPYLVAFDSIDSHEFFKVTMSFAHLWQTENT